MIRILLIIASICLSNNIVAEDNYIVDFKIHNKNQLLGTPSLVVELNKQARLSVDNSYQLSLIVKQDKSNSLYIQMDLTIDDTFLNPSMVVELGKETGFTINDVKLSVLINKSNS